MSFQSPVSDDAPVNLAAVDWQPFHATHPELAQLPDALCAVAKQINIVATCYIAHYQAPPQAMFYVLEGALQLTRQTRDGQLVVLQRVQRGFAAEASLDATRYHCDVQAIAGTTLLSFPIDQFRSELSNNPHFQTVWRQWLARELRKLRLRVERLTHPNAQARIEHYLLTEGEGLGATPTLIACNKKAWAAELGLTHEALYRCLAKLRNQGYRITTLTPNLFSITPSGHR